MKKKKNPKHKEFTKEKVNVFKGTITSTVKSTDSSWNSDMGFWSLIIESLRSLGYFHQP